MVKPVLELCVGECATFCLIFGIVCSDIQLEKLKMHGIMGKLLMAVLAALVALSSLETAEAVWKKKGVHSSFLFCS